MSIEAVIFDADGVLVFPWRFAAHLTQEYQITQEATQAFFEGKFTDCLLGKADLADVLPPYLAEWGWAGTTEEFMHLWFSVEDAVDIRMMDLVGRLRGDGLTCCLASNQEEHRSEYMRTAMGFGAKFDRLLFSCTIGFKKPDDRFYAAVEAALGLTGNGIAFWDDTPSHVEAAKKRGWQAELVYRLRGFRAAIRRNEVYGEQDTNLTGWRKQPIGDLPLYQAKTLAWLPRISQGFTTRRGGVSLAPYDSLNLGAHVGDNSVQVQANRRRVWHDLGVDESRVVLAEQVHGDKIEVITQGPGQTPAVGADGLITNTPDLLLMLFFADCVPVYLVDPVRKAIGLAHAGWRGTAANIAGKTMAAMTAEYGCLPSTCFAAVGPSIGGDSYEVGPEVADHFRTLPGARASTVVTPRSEMSGTYNLNLRAVVFGQLLYAGIPAGAIAVCDEDTFRNKRDFFSYRRDGSTGRMGAFLGIKGGKTG